jgi:hypothetical protein
VFASSRYSAEAAIRIVREQSKRLHFTINARKSGVLALYRNFPRNSAEGALLDLPYVKEYTCLGTWLSRTLTAAPHMANAGRRVDYTARRHWSCRKGMDVRFNTKLFRMLVVP